MTKDELFSLIQDEYSTEPDYPWADDSYAVFRHIHNRKWFCLYMPIPALKLGLKSTEITDVINVKTEPLLIASLIEKPGFYRAYHMNKSKWISIKLNEADENEVKDLLDLSFRLTE